MSFSWATDVNSWLALGILILLETVLGIDNVIFLSIILDNLPDRQRRNAKKLGIVIAMIMRVIMLISISQILVISQPIVTFFQHQISFRDLVLLCGGVFLIWKSTKEIYYLITRRQQNIEKKKFFLECCLTNNTIRYHL